MAIKDLHAKQGNVDLVVEIVDVGEPREFQKFGTAGRVCNATAKDETGEIKLTLWNDDIDKVKKGDKVHIENGYVSEWQGEMQLGTGRFGKLEVVKPGDGDGDSADESVTPDEETEAEIENLEDNTDEGEHILTDDEKTEEEVEDEYVKD
ncbi:MAG: OB-fold nucleic acid binding domain-containing protein [archaeon]